MKSTSLLLKLRRACKRYGSFLLLFQRSPAAQVLLPEVQFLTSSAGLETAKLAIATVVGLGAFDSVAGATTVAQVAPDADSRVVPVTAGGNFGGVFKIVGGGGHTPQSWSVSTGTLPSGLTLTSQKGKTTTMTGTTNQTGDFNVTIRAWEGGSFNGRSASGAFTIRVTAATPVSLTQQPQPATIFSGQTATLTVVATGGTPITYQWYQGGAGDTSTPVGGNSPSLTTPVLNATQSFWVRVSNALTPAGVDSDVVTVTVQAAATPEITDSELPPAMIGAAYDHVLAAANQPTGYVITGLPKGLKADPATGRISGRPTAVGSAEVRLKASNQFGFGPEVVLPLVVEALAPKRIGSFGGLVARDAGNRQLGGWFSLNVASTGAYTLKQVGAFGAKGSATSARSAKGFLAATAPQIETTLGGVPLTLTLNGDTGEVTGSLGEAACTGWRSAWSAQHPASAHAGYYSAAVEWARPEDAADSTLPQGAGYLTALVSPTGSVKFAGRAADGEALAGACLLGAGGEAWLHAPVAKKLGSLAATLQFVAATPVEDNRLEGDATWLRPALAGRLYPDGFDPRVLTVDGGRLGASTKLPVLGLPAPGAVRLSFSGAGVEASDTDPTLVFTLSDLYKLTLPGLADNPGKVAVKLNPKTGALSGSFTLQEASPPLTRGKVGFFGQIVRRSTGTNRVAGAFLLPQLPGAGETSKTSPVLSGAVELQEAP